MDIMKNKEIEGVTIIGGEERAYRRPSRRGTRVTINPRVKILATGNADAHINMDFDISRYHG